MINNKNITKNRNKIRIANKYKKNKIFKKINKNCKIINKNIKKSININIIKNPTIIILNITIINI